MMKNDRALVVNISQIAAGFAKTKPEGRTDYHAEQWAMDVVAMADLIEREMAQGGAMGTPAQFDVASFFAACGYEK